MSPGGCSESYWREPRIDKSDSAGTPRKEEERGLTEKKKAPLAGTQEAVLHIVG